MKTFYCHNTKLTETEGWATNDKKGSVLIRDHNNNITFMICFGKKPKMRAWKTKENGDFLNQIIGRQLD